MLIGDGAVLAGPVMDTEMFVPTVKLVDFAGFHVGSFDSECWFTAIVVCGVNQAASGSDQAEPSMCVHGKFVLPAGIGTEAWKEPFAGEIGGSLSTGVARAEAVGS